ncbi:MAG: hypothetical protein U0271_36495 [Polyangiaceae bacterium]
MMRPRVLECPTCGGPLRFQVPFCAYCRSPITWGDSLELDRGASVHAEHYPERPLLGGSLLRKESLEKSADGHVVVLRAGTASWAKAMRNARDSCVAVTGVTVEPHAGFAAVARAHTEGGVVDAYIAAVVPGLRSVRLARLCEGSDVSAVLPIRDWECSPHVAPIGYANTVELRVADTVLQLFVNGQRVLSAVDGGLGFGSFGWRAFSCEGPARVLIRALEVFAVSTR